MPSMSVKYLCSNRVKYKAMRLPFRMIVGILISVITMTQAARPRGVKPELATLYNPNQDFKCFDSSNVIPFNQVNDDYCDCEVSCLVSICQLSSE